MIRLVANMVGFGILFGISWAAHAVGAPWWAVAGSPLVLQAIIVMFQQSTADLDAI